MNPETMKPQNVWKHFFHICSIPHPSGHEDALVKSLYDWAKGKGFEASVDEHKNLRIFRPAGKGKENARGIILQAHSDMVPQANPDTAHDFLKDPIVPMLDPNDSGWLMATGTTLGADNGIGAAMALAILEEEDLVAGPIEVFLTSNEEAGMTGAINVADDFIKGDILLNLDGEFETELTVGCAGSVRVYGTYSHPAELIPQGAEFIKMELGGLLGGHSGGDIHRGRGNAAIDLARILAAALKENSGAWLLSLESGDAGNVIPRNGHAILAVEPGSRERVIKAARKEADRLKAIYARSDPDFAFTVSDASAPSGAAPNWALSLAGAAPGGAPMLELLGQIPNGVMAMDPNVSEAVQTSLNLGVVKGGVIDGRFVLDTTDLVRSSVDTERDEISGKLENHLAGLSPLGWGIQSRRPIAMAAWTPDHKSPLLEKAKKEYRDFFGKDAFISVVHGGLECAFFKPRFPHWDIISLGPDIQFPHSPGERVNIASVARMYDFLKKLIGSM